ncbi:MAG: NAD(P)H-hydrate dehydratase [Planctomycetota bacterium]
MPKLPRRMPEDHKGTFGTALLVGGSWGMTGAIGLAGMAALRGGAGLARLAVPKPCVPIVAAYHPCYTTLPLAADEEGRIAAPAFDAIAEQCESATAVGFGPGMGRSLELDQLVARLYQEVRRPMVVDADGLNALGAEADSLGNPGSPRVLTPHPGEFARLTGRRLPPEDRHAAAVELARRCGVVIVLKGHHTLVTDGHRVAVNATGNPGMATGGAGDVLTGVITALLCQGLEPFEAAQLGVYLHGLAGDLAAAELGEAGMIASDLLDFLPRAMRQHEQAG